MHRRFPLLLLLVIAGLTLCCAPGGKTHEDPQGFTIRLPDGWTVEKGPAGLIKAASAERRRFVAIQPFVASGGRGAARWLQTAEEPAALLPGLKAAQLRQLRAQPDDVVASGAFTLDGRPGRAALLCSVHGGAGMLYVIASTAEEYEQARPSLVSVLKSFAYTQPAGANPEESQQPSLKYTRWVDPNENAFSLEAPQAWQVQGGLVRLAPHITRAVYEMASPEGDIRILGGDPKVPEFTIPNQVTIMSGFPEGKWYNQYTLMRRYLTGLQFAEEYVLTMLGGRCQDVRITGRRERPEISEAQSLRLAQTGAGAGARWTFGEVAFTCEAGGRPMEGYYFAGTMSPPLVWTVTHLQGVIAATERFAFASEVAGRVRKSYRADVHWAMRQMRVTMAVAEANRRAGEEIAAMIEDGYWRREAVRDRAARRFSNAILSQTDLVDPRTGETFRAAAGHNYYWRAPRGGVAGTDAYDRPDIDFTPLAEY